MRTPPFIAMIPICDVNNWQHQNDDNEAVAVTVWTSFYHVIAIVASHQVKSIIENNTGHSN